MVMADNASVRSMPVNPRFTSFSDDELVAAAEKGDREAIVEFLRRNWAEFRRLAESRVSASGHLSHGLEDLLSTTARQVIAMVTGGRFRAQGAGPARGLVKTVLQRAIARTFRLQLRERRKLMHRAQSAPVTAPTSHLRGPDAMGSRYDLLTDFIRTLPERDYRTMVMRLDRSSFRNIGASLGCTEEAARQRWKVLRDRLTQLLSEAPESGADGEPGSLRPS